MLIECPDIKSEAVGDYPNYKILCTTTVERSELEDCPESARIILAGLEEAHYNALSWLVGKAEQNGLPVGIFWRTHPEFKREEDFISTRVMFRCYSRISFIDTPPSPD